MLFQLENTSKANVEKLIAFAKENKMNISLLDDMSNDLYLPGKPLTEDELHKLIEKSCNSSIISMEEGHSIIRNWKAN